MTKQYEANANPSDVQMICPNLRCRKFMTTPAENRGKMVRCWNCTCSIKVPEVRK
jgi:hypothetical protein